MKYPVCWANCYESKSLCNKTFWRWKSVSFVNLVFTGDNVPFASSPCGEQLGHLIHCPQGVVKFQLLVAGSSETWFHTLADCIIWCNILLPGSSVFQLLLQYSCCDKHLGPKHNLFQLFLLLGSLMFHPFSKFFTCGVTLMFPTSPLHNCSISALCKQKCHVLQFLERSDFFDHFNGYKSFPKTSIWADCGRFARCRQNTHYLGRLWEIDKLDKLLAECLSLQAVCGRMTSCWQNAGHSGNLWEVDKLLAECLSFRQFVGG